jgi:transposase
MPMDTDLPLSFPRRIVTLEDSIDSLDGDLDIDNNLSERVLWTVAIRRKNWLFAGSDAGAERAAVIYNLVATCRLYRVGPLVYRHDVLGRVSPHPTSRIAELMPSCWQS